MLDVRRAAPSDLINEKAALSGEMALRLEKAFGVSRVVERGAIETFAQTQMISSTIDVEIEILRTVKRGRR